MKALFSSICLALAALAIVACEPKGNPVDPVDPGTPTVAVTSVSLSQTSVTLDIGASVNLTATVSPSNATDKSVSWTSSNASVASVSNGTVTAVAEGTATITATAGGKSATCAVTVQRKVIAVTGVSLNKTALTLYPGDTFQLEATVSPADATDKTVTWTSSNAGVATVSNGVVTAVAEGTATITATAGGKSVSCAVTVQRKVIDVTSVSLNKTALTLYIGDTFQLEATVSPADATDKTVIWTSSNAAVATVDNGIVTAVAEGTATITATAGGKSASCEVTVQRKVVPVSGVSLNKTTLTLSPGATFQLVATVTPADATDKTVSWASSDPSKVTVENGLVKAVSPGTASVTATAGGKSAKCDITVLLPGSNEEFGNEDLK